MSPYKLEAYHRLDCRPSTELILCHPVFWDRNKIFHFFVDLKTNLDINLNETLTKKLRSHKLQVSSLQNSDDAIIKSYFSGGNCTVAYFLNVLFLGHDKYYSLVSHPLRLDSFQSKLRSKLQSYFPCIIHDLWYELKDFRDDVRLKNILQSNTMVDTCIQGFLNTVFEGFRKTFMLRNYNYYLRTSYY